MAYSFCPYCGAAIPDPAWRFCPYCGGRLLGTSGQDQPAVPATGPRQGIRALVFVAGLILVLVIAAILVQALAFHLVPVPVAADASALPSPAITPEVPAMADTATPVTTQSSPARDPDSTGNSTSPAAPVNTTLPVPAPSRMPASAGPVVTVTGTPPCPNQTPAMGSSPDVPVINTSSLEARIHALVNNVRQENRLPALGTDKALVSLARAHSTDMASHGYFGHVNLHEMDPTARGAAAGYTCRKDYDSYYPYGIAENLFATYRYSSVLFVDGRVIEFSWNTEEAIAEETVGAWMKSPDHRDNILDRNMGREGIGVAVAKDDMIFITQDLC